MWLWVVLLLEITKTTSCPRLLADLLPVTLHNDPKIGGTVPRVIKCYQSRYRATESVLEANLKT